VNYFKYTQIYTLNLNNSKIARNLIFCILACSSHCSDSGDIKFANFGWIKLKIWNFEVWLQLVQTNRSIDPCSVVRGKKEGTLVISFFMSLNPHPTPEEKFECTHTPYYLSHLVMILMKGRRTREVNRWSRAPFLEPEWSQCIDKMAIAQDRPKLF
jgi:hypothetical protein